MRAVFYLGLLLPCLACALPAQGQGPQVDPDPPSPPAQQRPDAQQPRGSLLGFRAPRPLPVTNSPVVVEGDIDQDDGVDAELGLKYEDFRFILEAGQRLRISASSLMTDPRIRVFGPGGPQLLAEDTDSGPGNSARLIFTPSDAGIHIVRVLGTFRGINGAYQLAIEPALPLAEPLATEGATVAETTRWHEFGGELSAADSRVDGLYLDDYQISLDAGQSIFVRLDSSDFDPVVQIYPAANREGDYIALDDDSGPGTNALLVFQSDQPGDYIVRVTTFSNDPATGRYTLRIGR